MRNSNQKYFNMDPIQYDEKTYYPIEYQENLYYIPLNYKEYAKESILQDEIWSAKIEEKKNQILMNMYQDYCSEKYRPKDKIEHYFGFAKECVMHPVIHEDELLNQAIESLLPEYTGQKEFVEHIIQKANESEPIYPVEIILQLNNYEEVER